MFGDAGGERVQAESECRRALLSSYLDLKGFKIFASSTAPGSDSVVSRSQTHKSGSARLMVHSPWRNTTCHYS